jgi:hypothetical protein
LTHKSRKPRKTPTIRIDSLLLANYGIFQQTRRHDAMTVFTPSIEALTTEERLDLFEFATFLRDDDRQCDFLDLQDQEELLQDEV